MNADGSEADPFVIEALIGRWEMWRKGAEHWYLQIDWGWRELLALRKEQRAYLARYGRQDLSLWKTRPVTELAEAVRMISGIVEEENSFNSIIEDR